MGNTAGRQLGPVEHESCEEEITNSSFLPSQIMIIELLSSLSRNLAWIR
jgi:hypothetical protein